MKRKLKYIILFFMLNINVVHASFSTNNVRKVCGFDYMPENLPTLTSGLFNLLKLLVPIILIIMGMVDFTRAMTGTDEQQMKKCQSRFITRLLAAIIVFVVVSLVQFVFNSVSISNNESFRSCVSCLINNRGCSTTSKLEKKEKCDDKQYDNCSDKDSYGVSCAHYKVGGVKSCRSVCSSITGNNLCNTKTYCSWDSSSNKCIDRANIKFNYVKTDKEEFTTMPSQKAIVDYALSVVTNPPHPYVWGGTTLCTNNSSKNNGYRGCGIDCSGFVQAVYQHFGYKCVSRTTYTQTADLGTNKLNDINALQPGDLIYFYNSSGPHHVALYIGNDEIVHAKGKKWGIVREKLSSRGEKDLSTATYIRVIGHPKCNK